jgi:hypothetical protein
MKRHINRFLKILFIMGIFFTCYLYASDMELELESGITVLLHEDHTWDYTPGSPEDLKEDISIMLDDGNAVKIKANQTWYYLDKAPAAPTYEAEHLRTVYSVGTAQGPDLFDAKTTAIDNAEKHLAKQLLSSSREKNLSFAKLKKCIEEEDRSIDIQERQSKDIWSVKVNMSLDSDQIRFILECAKERED